MTLPADVTVTLVYFLRVRVTTCELPTTHCPCPRPRPAQVVPKLAAGLIMYQTLPADLAVAKTFSLDWILPIFLRDFALMFFVAGGWDFIMYGPLFREKLRPYKFNLVYPAKEQVRRPADVGRGVEGRWS
jgi:hypothetical protein